MKNKSVKIVSLLTLAVLWVLVSASWVHGAGNQKISAEEIKEGAKQYLLEHLDWDPDRMDITLKYDNPDLVVPVGKKVLKYGLPGAKRRAGRIPLFLTVKVDGEYINKILLNAFVEVSYDVVKTRHFIKRNQILRGSDLKVVTIKSSRVIKNAVRNIEDVVGYKTIHQLDGGEMLKMHKVRKVPLVKRGDLVTLVIVRGMMKITVPGVVKEKGFKNSIVKVENIQSKKIVFGRVVSDKIIQVVF